MELNSPLDLTPLATGMERYDPRFQPSHPHLSAKELAAMAVEDARQRRLSAIFKRYFEGMRLYRTLPHLEAFHASRAKYRVLDGANRSMKTTTGAAEAVRAWTGTDPYDKYPPRDGNFIVVGLKHEHNGILWRKITKPGAFQIIRDEKTRLWRAVRPDPLDNTRLDPYDEAYREKWRDSPPLLPARFIRSVSMYKKSEGLPFFLELKTGWKVWFYSSDGDPSQGEHYNGAWIDEDISNYDHLKEIQRGLVGLQEKPEHRPKMFWTATGQSSNPQLLDLRENAERGVPDYAAFKTTIFQNPFVPHEEKESFAAGLSEAERRVRVFGEHALKARLCYPTFDATGPHGYDPFPIPPDWTRYLIIDPGSMFQGILTVAIDPNEEYLWVYDGILLRNSDAHGVARWVQQQEGQFELCVIDNRAGRQRQMGMALGTHVSLLYKKALDEAGITFRQQGPIDGFFPGSQDVAARQEALRTMMDPRASGPYAGTARFRVARGMLPELEEQIRRAQMDAKNPERRLKAAWREFQEDLLVCAEYIAAFDPRYFEPASVSVDPGSGVVDSFRAFQQKKRRKKTTSDSYR